MESCGGSEEVTIIDEADIVGRGGRGDRESWGDQGRESGGRRERC